MLKMYEKYGHKTTELYDINKVVFAVFPINSDKFTFELISEENITVIPKGTNMFL